MEFLVGVTKEAVEGTPILPIRYPMPEIDEISLTPDDSEIAPTPSVDDSNLWDGGLLLLFSTSICRINLLTN